MSTRFAITNKAKNIGEDVDILASLDTGGGCEMGNRNLVKYFGNSIKDKIQNYNVPQQCPF